MTKARTDEGSAARSRALLLAVIVGVAIGGRASTAHADETTTADPPAANDATQAEEPPPSVELDPRLIALEADKATRGRALIAAGVPLMLSGGIALGLGLGTECHQSGHRMTGAIEVGAVFTTVGVGFTTGGIVALLRASKAGRDAPRTRRQRGRLAGAATASVAVSVTATLLVSLFGVQNCLSS